MGYDIVGTHGSIVRRANDGSVGVIAAADITDPVWDVKEGAFGISGCNERGE